ncbi:MAG: right-handed parallel beta-helix repeat-containing protein [Bacteroidota bacterium]|nr:right-handed parallel beta-helix repeat-containing protein [Bacteroidota bacterium]
MKTKLNILQLSFVMFVVLIINVMNVSGQSWQNLGGPPVAKDVRDVSAGYKNGTFTIYAADAIKLSKSVDQGTNWSFINAMDSPLLVACRPDSSNTVLVAKGRDVWLSTNGGGEFIVEPRITNVAPLRLLYSRSSGDTVAWVGTKYKPNESSLRRSLDGGIEFRGIQYFAGTGTNPKTNVEDVWTVPQKPETVWVAGAQPKDITTKQGGASGLWRSINRGVSWSDTNFTMFFNNRTQRWEKIISGDVTAITTNQIGDQIYVGVSTGKNNGKITRYNFQNRTFDVLKNLSKPIKRLRATSSKIFAASEDGLYVGSIGVSPEKVAQIEGEVLSIDIDPMNENKILVGTNEYVYVSTDGGTSWSNKNPKTTIATLNTKAVAVSGNVILAIAERIKNKQDVIYRKNGSGWSAVNMAFAKDKFTVGKTSQGFYLHNGNTFFCFGRIEDKKDSVFIARSVDTGKTWTRSQINAGTSGAIINGIVRWQNKLYAFGKKASMGSTSTNIFSSSDAGLTWHPVAKIGLGTTFPEVFSIQVKDNNVAFAGTEKGLYVTQNGGGNWDFRLSATEGQKKILSLLFSEPYVYSATPQGYFRYDFNSLASVLQRKGSYKQVMVNNNDLYVLRDRSGSTKPDTIFRVTTGANWTWDTVAINRSAYDIRRFTIANDSIYQATDNGVFARRVSGQMTASSNPLPVVPGSNPNNIVWQSGSNVVISGTPTIPPGSTLTIEPGVNVVMTPGSQLRVQGELNIQGNVNSKVRFTSENPLQRWGGIILGKDARADIEYADINGAVAGIMGSKAELNINNSDVKNCLLGITMYGKQDEPSLIKDCRIENNVWGIASLGGNDAVVKNSRIAKGQKGVLVDASSPKIFGTTIEDNEQVGAVIYGGGYPRFGDIALDKPGLNIIQGNELTQLLAVGGYAFLGYLNGDCASQLGGDNLIPRTDPDIPLAVVVEKSDLTAMKTDWGFATFNPDDFLADASSKIVFECMTQEPTNDAEKKLWEALESRGSGLLNASVDNYKYIINNYGTTDEAVKGLVELYQTAKDIAQEEQGSIITGGLNPYLESLIAGSESAEIVKTASMILAQEYAANDMYDEAIQKYNQVLQMDIDSDTKISILLSKILLEALELESECEAEETLWQLKNEFSDDERIQIAEIMLELTKGDYTELSLGKSSSYRAAMRKFPEKNSTNTDGKPVEYKLNQNYPNPFNPSTLIKYQLPQANKVEIKIYNIFGQEIKRQAEFIFTDCLLVRLHL